MKTILLVGNSFHTIRDYLLDHGYEYVLLRDILLTKHPEKALKRRLVCDFSSWESIRKAVDIASQKHHFDGVMATYENYVLPAAQIADYLKLPGLPLEAAQACTDKYLMRSLFAAAPAKISPAYAEVTSAEQLRQFATEHSFPLILKPANLAKSLLVTKNHSHDELLQNYDKAMQTIDTIYQKYAPGRQPKLLVEEFMEGSVHSVDAFVDKDGTPHILEQVVDYQTGYDIGYDDNFHYSRVIPSRLEQATIDTMREVAAMGCRALGMKNSAAHVELILNNGRPMIVEIGARNGGYRDRMHGLANGIDIIGNAARIATGAQPEIVATKNESCAVLELFPRAKGEFTGLAHEQELQQLPSLVRYRLMAEPGQMVGKSSDGYKMTVIIVLHNADPAVFQRDLDYITKNVAVDINAKD